MVEPLHIHPTATLAERVLLPGDPGRAFRLAQTLLQAPKMFNHHRGLWGYTGTAADGQPLTIQSTGLGGPSCAIVVSELIALGARRLLRIGTCGALEASLTLGQLVVAAEAIGDDGTSQALGGRRRLAADPEILAGLQAVASDGPVSIGPIVSTDLFYDAEDRIEGWIAAGAVAVEMQAATLFALAARRGVQAGCAAIVSSRLVGTVDRIDGPALEEAERRLGDLAAGALACV